MKAHGGRWEGKIEAAVSLFPSSPARFLFFDHCFFHWDTQREPLRRKEQLRYPWIALTRAYVRRYVSDFPRQCVEKNIHAQRM